MTRLPILRTLTAQNFAGVIQRLVQKEKEVLQLQSELARASSSTSTRDEVRCRGDQSALTLQGDAKHERAGRAKQWSSLMDEIAKHKTLVRRRSSLRS